MKQILNKLSAFLIMLMCMSATAQAQTEVMTMVVTKKNGDVTRFEAKNITTVEWTNKDPRIGIGTAKAQINSNMVDVKWVQLWENGPKFAEYNVGVTDGKAESAGGHYCWGSIIDKDPNNAYNPSTVALTGLNDTATKLWGSNWRMPTLAELQALLDNCDFEWTTVNGVKGYKFTGMKGSYKSNSVFFPAASCSINGSVMREDKGYYWSSVPDALYSYISNILSLESNSLSMATINREWGCSVRAVLAE